MFPAAIGWAMAKAMTAAAAIRTKFARQPNCVCNRPPIIGATIGAKRADRSHQREFARRPHARIKVAHNGAREHDGARAADPLQEAGDNQRIDRRRDGADADARRVDHHRC